MADLSTFIREHGASQAVMSTALTLVHSARARGAQRTLLFAALGIGLPALGEYAGVNVLRVVRHHSRPQVRGVPLSAVLGWYNIGYATFAMIESLLAPAGLDSATRRWALPAATALTATSLDLLLDCFGLDAGLWEWNTDGPYAAEIAGRNGRHGIPLSNFAGWLGLTSTVTALYLRLSGDPGAGGRPGAAGSVAAGRTAALLLLPTYLGVLAWAVERRKLRYVLYSALLPLALALALRGRPAS